MSVKEIRNMFKEMRQKNAAKEKERIKNERVAADFGKQVANRDKVKLLWINAKKNLSKKHYCWWVEQASLWLREDMTNGQLNVLKSKCDLWRQQMKIFVTTVSWLMKTASFLLCMHAGIALKNWEIAGEPGTGWLVLQPFVYIALSIFGFYISTKIKKILS